MVSSKVKTALDFLPLIVFFVVFKWLGIIPATGALIAATLAVVAILFALERRVATTPLVTAVIVAVFGGLSIWFQDERFLKMKPTVVNLLFAAVLFVGCLRGKGWLHYIMGAALQLTDRGWWLLSRRFGFFFMAMALLNELIWRTMPTDWWVNFKVFGLLGLTLVFTMLQMSFIQKHLKPEEPSTNA